MAGPEAVQWMVGKRRYRTSGAIEGGAGGRSTLWRAGGATEHPARFSRLQDLCT